MKNIKKTKLRKSDIQNIDTFCDIKLWILWFKWKLEYFLLLSFVLFAWKLAVR